MDNFQPLLLNNSNGGSDWKEHGVAREQVEKRNLRTQEGSGEIWEYMQTLLDENQKKGSLR